LRRDCHEGSDLGADRNHDGNLGRPVGGGQHHVCVAGVFLGSEALARGDLTRGQLRWSYRKIHQNVYLPKDASKSLEESIRAAWLWSGRRGIIAGRAAAALHGAKWVDDRAPVEIVGRLNHPPTGIIVRRERVTAEDVVQRGELFVTNPARTAFDLARHLPRGVAVAHLDALAAATGISARGVAPLIARNKGARGVRLAKMALSLMDSGSQSPKETWLRLMLIEAGFPRPRTQIEVRDRGGFVFAYLDMGWEAPMVAVEYDGDQHRSDRKQYVKDIRRLHALEELGWRVVRIVSEDRPAQIIERVASALRAPPRLP
jgi:hypothetical protein